MMFLQILIIWKINLLQLMDFNLVIMLVMEKLAGT